MSIQQNLLTVVESLQEAARRHATDQVMAYFADDAEFELVGVTRLVGKPQIRPVFEYDAGVEGEIRFINCTTQPSSVTCQMVEQNDRLRAAGLDQLLYPTCVFSFENNLIRSWRATPDPEALHAFDQFWGLVRRWIAENYPADYARIFTPEGRFIRNGDNGKRVVQFAKAYRSSIGS